MKFLKLGILTMTCALVLAGCESMYTEDPYTGEKQVRKSVKYGAIAAATCAVGAAVASGDDKGKNAAIGAAACGAAGAGVGHYFDAQEAKLRERLRGTGVSVYRNGDQIQLVMPGGITFATNSADISADFYPVLGSVALVLKEYDQTLIDIVGHTDSTGSDSYNQDLSERRAHSVAHYLNNQGIGGSRLNAWGMGERQPIASNDTADGRNQNRRVEITIRPMQG